MGEEAIPAFSFSTQFHPSILRMSTSVMGLYSLSSIQDLSAEDPALYLTNSLISTQKKSELSLFMKLKD